MKRSYIMMAVAACVLAAIFSTVSTGYVHAGAKKPAKAEAFETSPGYEKLDLRLKDAWREQPGSKKTLECILKAKERLSGDDKAALAAAGFNYRTVIGRIATGNLQVRDVPDVANLQFIQVMELAVPLNLKKK